MPKVSRRDTFDDLPLAVALEGIAVRTRVRDDGSAWIYAVLACLGYCEHAQPAPFDATFRRQPSVRDMLFDRAIRRWLFNNRDRITHPSHIPDNICVVPDYSGSEDRSFWGCHGDAEWVAAALGVQLLFCYREYDNEMEEATMFVKQHRQTFPTQPLVIVAYSEDIERHFEAYVLLNQPRYELPDWLATPHEDITEWLLLCPREYDDDSSHPGAREDGTFLVDTIIAWQMTAHGTKEFLVRWVGWEACTWEPEENVPRALWLEFNAVGGVQFEYTKLPV